MFVYQSHTRNTHFYKKVSAKTFKQKETCIQVFIRLKNAQS